MAFYVDSCIYLNLWQKEVAASGKELWKISEVFFNMCDFNNQTILYSGFVLKELQWIAPEAFAVNKDVFSDLRFKKVFAVMKDYEAARKFESASNFGISFFDCMHVVLAGKMNAVLITRDNDLIDFATGRCKVMKPKDCFKEN